jgi:hypothetical protein
MRNTVTWFREQTDMIMPFRSAQQAGCPPSKERLFPPHDYKPRGHPQTEVLVKQGIMVVSLWR